MSVAEQVTADAIARVEAKVAHIKRIQRLRWRIAQVREWADDEALRLERQLLEAEGEYQRWQDADALRRAAEAQAVQS